MNPHNFRKDGEDAFLHPTNSQALLAEVNAKYEMVVNSAPKFFTTHETLGHQGPSDDYFGDPSLFGTDGKAKQTTPTLRSQQHTNRLNDGAGAGRGLLNNSGRKRPFVAKAAYQGKTVDKEQIRSQLFNATTSNMPPSTSPLKAGLPGRSPPRSLADSNASNFRGNVNIEPRNNPSAGNSFIDRSPTQPFESPIRTRAMPVLPGLDDETTLENQQGRANDMNTTNARLGLTARGQTTRLLPGVLALPKNPRANNINAVRGPAANNINNISTSNTVGNSSNAPPPSSRNINNIYKPRSNNINNVAGGNNINSRNINNINEIGNASTPRSNNNILQDVYARIEEIQNEGLSPRLQHSEFQEQEEPAEFNPFEDNTDLFAEGDMKLEKSFEPAFGGFEPTLKKRKQEGDATHDGIADGFDLDGIEGSDADFLRGTNESPVDASNRLEVDEFADAYNDADPGNLDQGAMILPPGGGDGLDDLMGDLIGAPDLSTGDLMGPPKSTSAPKSDDGINAVTEAEVERRMRDMLGQKRTPSAPASRNNINNINNPRSNNINNFIGSRIAAPAPSSRNINNINNCVIGPHSAFNSVTGNGGNIRNKEGMRVDATDIAQIQNALAETNNNPFGALQNDIMEQPSTTILPADAGLCTNLADLGRGLLGGNKGQTNSRIQFLAREAAKERRGPPVTKSIAGFGGNASLTVNRALPTLGGGKSGGRGLPPVVGSTSGNNAPNKPLPPVQGGMKPLPTLGAGKTMRMPPRTIRANEVQVHQRAGRTIRVPGAELIPAESMDLRRTPAGTAAAAAANKDSLGSGVTGIGGGVVSKAGGGIAMSGNPLKKLKPFPTQPSPGEIIASKMKWDFELNEDADEDDNPFDQPPLEPLDENPFL